MISKTVKSTFLKSGMNRPKDTKLRFVTSKHGKMSFLKDFIQIFFQEYIEISFERD